MNLIQLWVELQHGIDDENATKQTQKYRDAEQSKENCL